MPLVRFKIRNELSLCEPELDRSPAVEYEEPKAILGAVEVAGVIGILRQLGDLAEFSAEVFNAIQEEVTVMASRCQKLTSRVKRIESALSPLEKAVLSQTSHIHFAYTAGSEWHPRIRNGCSHFVQSDLPLCVMENYEQCRDPPSLHLLDRFSIDGPGSCLRKYSDPTFFRKELGNPNKADDINVQRDQAHRKRKKKKSLQRNICRSNAVSTSDETNGGHLSSLTDDRRTTSQSTSTVDMPRSSNMQELSDIIDQSHLQGQLDEQEQSEAQLPSDFQESSKARDSITGSGYIEYVINQSPVNKPEVKVLDDYLSGPLQPADRIGSVVPEDCNVVIDDNILNSPSEHLHEPCASVVHDKKKETLEPMEEKSSKFEEVSETDESKFGPGTPDRVRQNQRDFGRTNILFDEVDIVGKSQANNIGGTPVIENEGEYKSEQESEVDEFVDARNTIESESESEVSNPKLEHYFGDVSTYCSEDANSDNNDGSEDISYEQMADDLRHETPLDESCSGSCLPNDANDSCCLSDPAVPGKILSHDETFQPWEFFAKFPSSLAEEAFPDITILGEEPVAPHPFSAENCTNENISPEDPVSSCLPLKDAIPAENILPKEYLANNPPLAEDVPHEKISPGESVAKVLFCAEMTEMLSEDGPKSVRDVQEIIPQEEVLPKKSPPKTPSVVEAVSDNMASSGSPDSAYPSFPKATQAKNNSPGVFDSKNLSAPEADLQKISLEESVGKYPCLVEAVPDERFLTEELEGPATTCLSLTKAIPTEKLFPERLLEEPHYLAELPKEKILQETSVGASYPSCDKDAPEANLSSDVLASTNLSAAEAVSQEQISFEKSVDVNQHLAVAIPDERFTPEQPITTHPFLTKSVAIEKVSAEELLETYPSFEELPEEKCLHEEIDDATDPYEAVSDEEVSSEISNTTNLSSEETLPQEQIPLDEFGGINPCLVEPIPDESFLSEEHATTCLSLEKGAAIERVLPEKRLETYPSLAELSKEKILHEEINGATHPSEAVCDEEMSSEVSDSTNLSLEEALSQEKISHEEFAGLNPCLAEAIPDERFLTERPVTPYLSLTEAAAVEGILSENILEMYHSLVELPEENIAHEEADDATDLSLFEAISDEKILPELLDSTSLLLAEPVPQEQISVEECVSIDPCFTEAIPDKRVLPEEPVTKSLSFTKAVPMGEALPEEPLEAYASLEHLTKNKISQEKSDDTKDTSCAKAESDENIASDVNLTNLSVAETIPQEQISLEEFIGLDTFSAVSVLDERFLPEEPITTCLPLTKTAPMETILPEESSEVYPSLEELYEEKIMQKEEPDDATHPSFSEAVDDEKILEGPTDSTYPSLEESVPHEKTSHEDLVGKNLFLAVAVPDERILPEEPVTTCLPLTKAAPIKTIFPEESLEVYPSLEESQEEKIFQEEHVSSNPFLELAGPNESIFPEEPGFTYQSVPEAVFKENNLPEKSLPLYPSLAEAVAYETISSEEPDASCPPSAEVVFDDISGSEAPGSMIESGPHNKAFPEEPLATDNSLAEACFHETILGSEAPGSTTENGPHNQVFPEEPLATDNSLAEACFHEMIPGSEASGSTTGNGPHNKVFPEEPLAMDNSVGESCFHETILGSEAPGSATENGPQNNNHVSGDNILPKEPVATYLALAEGIPDQKVCLDDATLLLFAEAIFDQKFSPEFPDSTYPSLKEPEKHVSVPSLVTDPPAKNILVKEGEAYDEPYAVRISPDKESVSNGTNVEPVNIWSNGGLLGLAPLKPPVFAEPNSVGEHLQNEINEASGLSKRKQGSSSQTVENAEESSLPLVVSDPTSQQQKNKLSPSRLQSTGTSFTVFGLSQRLLMAGFRGNSSSTCKFESVPSSSCDTRVAAIEDKTEHEQTPGGSSFEEQVDYKSSFFDSPTSSPPVEHMKISLNPREASSVPKLNLRIPCQPQCNGQNADMFFPSFQLVPESSNFDDEDNSDNFCQSSPSVSENCLSDSELWESDESPRKSVSSLKEVEERSRDNEMCSFSGSSLDLPCYDAIDGQSTSSRQEKEHVPEYKPSVSEIIRDWPPNQPKSSPSNEATVMKKAQNQSLGLVATDEDGER